MDPGPDTGRERAIDMVETILDERGATAPSVLLPVATINAVVTAILVVAL